MSLDLDHVFMTALMVLAYGIGAALVLAPVRILPGAIPAHGGAVLLLLLPLAATVVAELATGLWDRTPGAVGTGQLGVVVPLLLAGLITALALVVADRLLPAWEPWRLRDQPALTAWLLAAMAASVVSLLLWRYWPEPRARLW